MPVRDSVSLSLTGILSTATVGWAMRSPPAPGLVLVGRDGVGIEAREEQSGENYDDTGGDGKVAH
jgi:hypothetical protein